MVTHSIPPDILNFKLVNPRGLIGTTRVREDQISQSPHRQLKRRIGRVSAAVIGWGDQKKIQRFLVFRQLLHQLTTPRAKVTLK